MFERWKKINNPLFPLACYKMCSNIRRIVVSSVNESSLQVILTQTSCCVACTKYSVQHYGLGLGKDIMQRCT